MPRPIVVDGYVRTADGALGLVRYVAEARGEAEVRTCTEDGDANGEHMTLPIAELRRVADPRNKRPRVEGMPAERPRCEWCNDPLRPSVVNHYSDEVKLWRRRIVRRTFDGWITFAGGFHSKGCAYEFAGAAFRAGYRRKRG